MDGYLRGRHSGEVAQLLRAGLVRNGLADAAIVQCLDETEAVRSILAAAGPGDSLALPVHGSAAREQVSALLDQLQARGWRPGDAVTGGDRSP